MSIQELVQKVASELKAETLHLSVKERIVEFEIGLNGVGGVADVDKPVATVRFTLILP